MQLSFLVKMKSLPSVDSLSTDSSNQENILFKKENNSLLESNVIQELITEIESNHVQIPHRAKEILLSSHDVPHLHSLSAYKQSSTSSSYYTQSCIEMRNKIALVKNQVRFYRSVVLYICSI